ncbi:serine hydrolase domain-containing protein [Bacillus sp. CGMCC 1.16607]|uniref:serine hydrolase domain-containing protein n=1 Tax=Bacillus sp. CGMCC 1.16607 TaxID=3351842 RepID=UPI003639E515
MLEISSQLKRYMDGLADNNYFNGAVLVGYKGEILLKEGYGQASYQYSIPNNTTTKFRIGSLTKAFTAMAILMLHEQGRLKLTDSLVQHLPEFRDWEAVTIHHLLSNTSGIPCFTSFPDYWTKTMRLPATIAQFFESIKEMPLEFTPGEKMEYSNSGYLILTAIIEKISGQSYADYLQDSIIVPLGLTNTGVDNGRTIVESLATGHTVWERVVHTDFIDMSFPLGVYGMYSNLEDLYKWSQALQRSELLDEKLQQQMFTGNPYGYGWFLEELPEKKASHFGDINGFVSYFEINLHQDLTVIVLSNINITPVSQMSQDLANIVLGKSASFVEIPSKVTKTIPFDKFTGTYANGRQEIKFDFKEELFATIPKMYGVPYKFKLVPVLADDERVVFKSDFIHDTYEFKLNGHGDIELFELTDCYGLKSEYRKND